MAYQHYSEVPFYRTSSFGSVLVLSSFLGLPGVPLVVLILLTGDIYYSQKDQLGALKTWSKANRYAAMFLALVYLAGIIAALTGHLD